MPLLALLAALAVALVPTVLFVGLWRGLLRLRETALQRYGDPNDRGQPTGLPGASSSAPAADGSPAVVACPDCGTGNDGYATFCAACLRKL